MLEFCNKKNPILKVKMYVIELLVIFVIFFSLNLFVLKTINKNLDLLRRKLKIDKRV